ncbi:HTTM domain-containing protein [Streptomyces sp. LX-29]|uniref:HTTM domain-containing protein n=1 Tax=Streptomyces sp. LX-29 TaxID=2900152 RepID=UPI00240E4186|nr:HTTM domain-containing protein [Streptomyces sp. LX-29]WFB11684.1 HTTM domain-containing protein [Streptomyces sp. LX-29]
MSAPVEAAFGRGLARVTGSALGPYQTAVIRIGFAFTWLAFLVREWPHRRQLYGPDAPLDWDMARQVLDANHAFSALMWSSGTLWFEIVYGLSLASSALLLLGWRTRTMSVLFMIGVLSLQNRSIFIGDGGDNVVHLMATYLVLTRCGQVWSLDARRAARRAAREREGRLPPDRAGIVLWAATGIALAVVHLGTDADLAWTARGPLPGLGWAAVLWGLWLVHAAWWLARRYAPGEPRLVLDALANLVHNGALLVIMAEVCLIYATAGWYKIQGSRWQDGTALYYALHLDYFSPWPGLADQLADNGLLVMALTYGTVAVQVAFPFTLFNRRVKNVLLAVMVMEHIGIAIALGLPFLSLAMIAADSVFLPTSALRWLGGRVRRIRDRLLPGPAATTPGVPGTGVPEAESAADGRVRGGVAAAGRVARVERRPRVGR